MASVRKNNELLDAAKRGDLEGLARLLKAKASPDGAGFGQPLLEALSAGHWACAEALANAGADLNAGDANSGTPISLRLALERPDSMEGLEWLLRRGADANAIWRGMSALGWLCVYGAHEQAGLFLKFGADANWSRADGDNAPLSIAAKGGCPKTVGLLLAAGADWRARDSEGKTALELAQEQESFAEERAVVAEMLKAQDQRAQLEALDLGGKGPRSRSL